MRNSISYIWKSLIRDSRIITKYEIKRSLHKEGGFSDDQEYDKNKKNIIIWKKFIELFN